MEKFNLDILDRETFCDIFKFTANKFKHKIAIVCNDSTITYSELDKKTDLIACCVAGKGFKSEDVIAINLERSINAIAAMIGIWKAGCAFVYLDSSYPGERLEYMIDKCNCQLIITEDFINNLDKLTQNEPKSYNSNNLAEIIFTSGSTGKPKGVMLEHKNIAALVKSYHVLDFESDDIVGVFANLCFVAVNNDIFTTLAIGGTVNIIPNEIRKSIKALAKYYIDNKITITFLPPHMASKFMEIDFNTTLKTLIVGSEPARNLKKRHYKIQHVYGSTETCTLISNYLISEESSSYPIGKFRKSVRYYILDENGNRVNPGQVGELCVSGSQIARGYLSDPQKTALCFVKNEFSDEEEFSQIFKTGDLVKELVDGNIQYIGRKDWMFKIRGFRVEASEVELALLKYEGVIEAAVTAFSDSGGTNILCGYYISDEKIDPLKIKNFLSNNLPFYMVPPILLQLNEFPRNQNNKINKVALPKPTLDITDFHR